MTTTGAHTKKATPIAIAGRRMRRWIARSVTSTFQKHRQSTIPSDATASSSSSATDLVPSGLKDRVKTTQSSRVSHDVFLRSETVEKALDVSATESSGSSSHLSSSGGLADGESISDSTSPDEDHEELPTLVASDRCDDCKSQRSSCAPDIAVVPPSPLQPSRPLSPTSSTLPNDIDASQIPDEEGLQVEITEAQQPTDSDHTEDTTSDDASHFPDLWGQTQETEGQWGECDAIYAWSELQDLSNTPPTSDSPDSAEDQDPSITLESPGGRTTLTLGRFLGSGSYGKVVSAEWVEGQQQVAVKVSHKLFISELDCTEPGLKSLKNELDVLKALNLSKGYRELGSNFFPTLFKSWQDTKNVYFVMEMYPWNLEELRWADPTWEITDDDKVLWAAELILGVRALRRMRILHRDIKPANIFVTSSKHLVIGDYGLAQHWLDPFYANVPSTSLKARDAPGTMAYLAPEVVRGFYQDAANIEVRKFASYSFEADIWSLGVTICDSWSQTTGLFHLSEDQEHLDFKSEIPPKILEMEVEPAVKRIVGEHPMWHLITRMLDRNPLSRIGFDEMLAHPVFALLDWNKVASLSYCPTWRFPERDPSKKQKPVTDAIEFTSYYQSPEDICIDETDSEQTKADKLDRRNVQILRRAMGAARDWMGEQQTWLADGTLREYDFDWTSTEALALEDRWVEDDD